MSQESNYLICPCCKAKVYKGKYCPECGSPLGGPIVSVCNDNQVDNNDSFVSEKEAVSDQGLTLLVNICKKTIATVGGDGYSEIVLYLNESNDEYWLHTYSKYVYMNKEAHASYITTKEFALKVMKYIENHNLSSYKDVKGFALCGGDYIIKFKHNNEYIRLDSSNMIDNLQAYHELSNMLYSEITDKNRHYKEN